MNYVDRCVWLEAELVRVRGERDRLFAVAWQDHQREGDQIFDRLDPTPEQSTEAVLGWMRCFLVSRVHGWPAVAAALAEHDRPAGGSAGGES